MWSSRSRTTTGRRTTLRLCSKSDVLNPPSSREVGAHVESAPVQLGAVEVSNGGRCRGSAVELDDRRARGYRSVISAHDKLHRRDVADRREVLAQEVEDTILVTQSNLASTYASIGKVEQALEMDRVIYCGRVKLDGKESKSTLLAALNYASSLYDLQRFKEARSLMRKVIPAARRVFGENNEFTLKMRKIFADSLYNDDDATLDDLREAVAMLEETERTTRRVFGGAHPLTNRMEKPLRQARAALHAHKTPSPPPPPES